MEPIGCMDDKTTIEVDKSTRKRLKVWKAKNEMTYDEAINHLIKEKIHILFTYPYDNDTGEETIVRGVFGSENAAEEYAERKIMTGTHYSIEEYEVD